RSGSAGSDAVALARMRQRARPAGNRRAASGQPRGGGPRPCGYALRWAIVLLLAFDTATPAVTVAVHDGDRVLAPATTGDARRQGELLASHIEKVLAQAGAGPAEPTAVVARGGPGPYTGLRHRAV